MCAFVRGIRLLLLLMMMSQQGLVDAQSGTTTMDTCMAFGDGTGWIFQTNLGVLPDACIQVRNGNITISPHLTNIDIIYVVSPDVGWELAEGTLVIFGANLRWDDSLTLGVMSNVLDTTTFVEVMNIQGGEGSQRLAKLLPSIPSGCRHIALRYRRNRATEEAFGNTWLDLGRFRINAVNPCWAGNLRWTCTAPDSVRFEWDYIGEPTISMTLLDEDDTNAMTNYHDYNNLQGGSVDIPIVSGHSCIYTFSAQCDTLAAECSSNQFQAGRFVPEYQFRYDSSDCIDLSALYSNKAVPYYGTFANPYSNYNTVVDMGSSSSYSRHTVNTDTSQRDPVVGAALRTIPEGESISVRLGNWRVYAQAEAMLYTLPVDTNVADMLILRYAAVMQNPMHQPFAQPRFRIEFLDDEMNLIEPAGCNSYDFISSPELGWNYIPLSVVAAEEGGYWNINSVLWKDWTTVGLDISAYHGRTVRLRLTTYDCPLGGHFCYAYYTLSCARKNFTFQSCTEGDSNSISAPDGFSYRWRRDDAPSVVISTSRDITLPVDNHTYFCDLGFIGDTSCTVTMSIVSTNFVPVAKMGYYVERDSCRFKVTLHNRSHFIEDTLHRGPYTEWIFENGSRSLRENPVVYFTDTGLYRVTLVSGLAPGICTDTVYDTLRLYKVYDTTFASICKSQSFLFCDSLFSTSGSYTLKPNCDSIRTLYLSVNDTTLRDTFAVVCHSLLYRDSLLSESGQYDFVYPDAQGCDSTYRLHLQIHPAYELYDTLRFCRGYPYIYRGVDYGGPTSFDAYLHTSHDCDSLVHVTLETLDSAFYARAYYSVDQHQWSDSLPILLCTPSTLYLRDSSALAVSWLWSLSSGETSSGPTPQFLIQDSSISQRILQLEVESAGGCRDTLLWPILIFPRPHADFQWFLDHPVDIAPNIRFIDNTTPEEGDRQWFVQKEQGGNDFDTLFGPDPFYTWQGNLPVGDFDVRLVAMYPYLLNVPDTILTCTDTAKHTITIVTAFLQFPNLVTPNGDGVNDTWRVINLLELGLYSMNELWIYNSWGVLVYHVEDIHREEQFWNPNDTHSPDGTYYFRFSAKAFHGLVRVNGAIEVAR